MAFWDVQRIAYHTQQATGTPIFVRDRTGPGRPVKYQIWPGPGQNQSGTESKELSGNQSGPGQDYYYILKILIIISNTEQVF